MLWRSSTPKRQSPGFIEPCIPTRADKPPVGPDWVHEIKHDGYRLIAPKPPPWASVHKSLSHSLYSVGHLHTSYST